MFILPSVFTTEHKVYPYAKVLIDSYSTYTGMSFPRITYLQMVVDSYSTYTGISFPRITYLQMVVDLIRIPVY